MSQSVLLCLFECHRHVHGDELTCIFSQFWPSLLAAAPLSVLAVTSRGGRVARRNGGRKEEEGVRGPVGGTRSRTQEVESDEEAGDNVMRRGAEPEDGGGIREGK